MKKLTSLTFFRSREKHTYSILKRTTLLLCILMLGVGHMWGTTATITMEGAKAKNTKGQMITISSNSSSSQITTSDPTVTCSASGIVVSSGDDKKVTYDGTQYWVVQPYSGNSATYWSNAGTVSYSTTFTIPDNYKYTLSSITYAIGRLQDTYSASVVINNGTSDVYTIASATAVKPTNNVISGTTVNDLSTQLNSGTYTLKVNVSSTLTGGTGKYIGLAKIVLTGDLQSATSAQWQLFDDQLNQWTDAMTVTDGVASVTKSLERAGVYKFKIRKSTDNGSSWTYYGATASNNWMYLGNHENWDLVTSNNQYVNMTAAASGSYTFNYTISTQKLTVTYPDNSIMVTFEKNDGTSTKNYDFTSTGQAIPRPENPTRSGFSFVGWFENQECTGSAWNFSTTLNANKTLYAKWSNSYYYHDAWINDWAANEMTESADKTYWYYPVKWSSNNRLFKIQRNGTWYGYQYNDPGFHCTNITNMNSSSSTWSVTDNRCAVNYNSSEDYYIIVYVPNTGVNTTNSPKICAANFLPESSYALTAGSKVYFDNSDRQWENVYFRIGHNCWTNKIDMTKVPGTKNLYECTTTTFNDYNAFHVADNTAWTNANSIYALRPGSYNVDNCLEFQKYAITGDITLQPTTTSSTGVPYYYGVTKTDGMLTHKAKLTTPEHCTLTVTYTDAAGTTNQQLTTSDKNLAHTCKLTVSATAATGYKDPVVKVNGTTIDPSQEYILTEDATFSVTVSPNTNTAYTVKHFKQNLDGTYPSEPFATDNLTGTTGAEITPPVKTGSDITGFTAPSTQTTTILADGSRVVTYNYTRNAHTLTWTLNGGTITQAGTAAGSVKYGATLTAPTVEKTGYTFTEWTPAVPTTMPDADATYSAGWTATPYTITYDNLQGTTKSDQTSYTIETATFDLTAPTGTYTGHTFDGWWTGEGGTGTQVTQIAQGSTGDKHLYAKWTCVTPTFATNLSTEEVQYTQGDEATALTVAANQTFTLKYQWQSSENGTSGWTNVGTNSASYTPSTENEGTTYYRCTITNENSGCSAAATSAIAHITVNPSGVCTEIVKFTMPSSITTQTQMTVSTTDGKGNGYYYLKSSSTGSGGYRLVDTNPANYIGVALKSGTFKAGDKVTVNITGVPGMSGHKYLKIFSSSDATESTLLGTKENPQTIGDYVFTLTKDAAGIYVVRNATYEQDPYVKSISVCRGGGTAHTVTFDATTNGGTCTTASLTEESAGAGVTLPTATKEGHNLSGWFTAATSGTKVGDANATYYPAEDITVYAQFTARVTTITFDKEGGDGGSNTVQATYGENMPAIELPTRTGYTFGGYYDGDGGTGTQYYTNAGESARTWDYGADEKTLYAKWTEITTTGISASPSTIKLKKGASTSITATVVPATALHQEVTWETAGSGQYTLSGVNDNPVTITGAKACKNKGFKVYTYSSAQQASLSITVYYEVQYVTNGGGSITAGEYTDTKITLPTPPSTPSGKTFAGWYSNEGLTSKVGDAGADYTPTDNTTLYAKWVDATVDPTITFNNGNYTIGGSALDLSTLFSSNSKGTVTYSVKNANGTGATITGTNFTATTAGTAAVTASQAAVTGYNAKAVDATITVSAAADLTALESGVLYKPGNMLPSGQTISSSSLYVSGISANSKFEIIGTASAASGDNGVPEIKTGSSVTRGDCTSNEYLYFKGAAQTTSNIPTSRAIKFMIPTGGGSLKVYANGNLKIIKDGASSASDVTVNNSVATINVTAGTYYLYADASSRNITGLKFTTSATTYTITYNMNGHGTQIDPVTGATALPATLPTPTATGYTFGGWYTNSGLTQAAVAGATISANTTLYAKWTAEQYTLTLDKNGASANGQATVSFNATSATITTAVTPATGKTIEGYYAEDACTTKVLKADGSFAASNVSDYITSGKWTKTTNCTLYAKSIDAPTPGACVETDYKSSSEIANTSFSTKNGTWNTNGPSSDPNYFMTSSSTGSVTLNWSKGNALELGEGVSNNGVITIRFAHHAENKGFTLYVNGTQRNTYTATASEQIYEVDYEIPTSIDSITSIEAKGSSTSGLKLYHIEVCPAGAATCTDPGLAYSTTTVTKDDDDEAFTHPLTNTHNVAVTYTSSKSDVASVDANGQVTIKKAGTTVIKASSVKQTISGTSYCADEASYTLTVNSTCTAPTISWNVTPTAIAAVSGTCSASVTTNYAEGVTWSASPSGKVTFSSTTGATTTITATATGQVTITAKVLGAGAYCAEEKSVQATITIGGATGGHVITHDTPTNGTFDVLLNGEHTTSANKGQLIALTATPDPSYTFNAWNVYKTGDTSTKITVTNNTFIMPDYDVTVQATFKTKGGTSSGCYSWGYDEEVTTVPTTNNDVTVDNRLVLQNRGHGTSKSTTMFNGSQNFAAISLHGLEEYVAGNLSGATIDSIMFDINTTGGDKANRCFVAFCSSDQFQDNKVQYLLDIDDAGHNAKTFTNLPKNNGTRTTYKIAAPANAKSFAIARNFNNIDSVTNYKPDTTNGGWMPSAYRYLYHLKVCGGGSATVMAVAPIGIVRDTTITCGTSTAIKLTAYGSLENGNTWYWQTTETGTSTTYQGATFDVTRAGTYYVRSRCVNPSDANDVSWSVARSITVPASAWTALPEISDLCGSTSGAATINYTVGQAASKLYVEASNTSKVVWYSNTSATTSGGDSLCAGVLSGGKYYTEDPVSTTAVGTQYYYCEIFNGTCAVTSPLVTVDVKAASGYDKFSLVMKDQLADQSVAGKTSMAISGETMATISGGTAALENLSSAAGKAQIVNDHLYLASSDGLVVVNLNYPLAAGDKIVITNRIADNANQYALTATKERNTEIVTENDEYTIPAGSPLIGIKTLYIWRSTTAITYIKTINVKCDAQPTCQGPTFTSISANHTTIGKGSSVTLTAAASASGALTYQWYKADGTSAGAAGAQLTLSNMQSTTSYYCVATENGCATSVKSTGITINVTECATPTIAWATAPANLTVGEGNGEATVNTNRTAGVVYTWAAANSTSGAVELSGDGTGKVTITPVAAGTVRITATVTGDGAVVCDGSASVYQEITINPALEKYTIGYDLDEGTAGTGAPTIANRNEWVEIPNPTKSGCDFAGWTVSSGLDVTNGYWNTTNSSTGQDKIEYPCKVCYNATGNVYIYNAGANGQSIQLTAKWYVKCTSSATATPYYNGTTGTTSVTNLRRDVSNKGYTCRWTGITTPNYDASSKTKLLDLYMPYSGRIIMDGNYITFKKYSNKGSIVYIYVPSSSSEGTITFNCKQNGDAARLITIYNSTGATSKNISYGTSGLKSLDFESSDLILMNDSSFIKLVSTDNGDFKGIEYIEVSLNSGGSGASCHHVIYHASYSDATGVTNDDQSYGSSDKATIKQCGFTRAGFDFVGWNTTKGATTKMDDYDPGDEVTLSADLVLYAVWKESQATAPTVNWTDVPATVYPGMQFTFTVTTNSDDPNLSVASLTATANATLINKSISDKTITATCQINAATNSNPVLTLTTAGTSTYRSSVSTQSPTLQTCAGSNYQTIFSYTAKTTETALGTYAANGGTATLSGKAMNGNDVLTVNEQNYIQMRAGSNWVFTLDGNATFQAGDEITFTFASNDSVDRRTGVDLYMSLFNTNVPYGETASITYILQTDSDDVSERIIGTNQLMMERANQFMKFGSITVRRATIGQTSIQAPTLEFWDAVGDSVIPVGHTVNKKVDAIPFTISAKSNSSGEITYASYDIGVAIVNPETGEVSKPIAGGQTVITATIAANGCYNAKTIYYALVVDSTDCGIIPHLENPLPTDQTATLGETVSFTVVASNADTYQWYSCDNTEEDNTEVIPGANSATYSFTATEVGKKFYFCKVSSSCRSVVKTEPRFAQINPLPYTITYTAGVHDGTIYTEANFTADKITTKPNYIQNLSNYFFINGAAIHGPANGTMSSTIDIPMSRTETNYTGFNFNVLESYYLTVDSIKLNVAAVGTTGIQVQAILSDNHDHAISSAIKTITEGLNQAVRLDFPNLDVQLVDQVTMKILAWYDDANAYIRIGETTGIDGKIHSLPEPTIQWTSVPKDGTAGKDMLIAAESNITISDITYTSSNTAVASISDVEDVDAKRLRYVAAGTSTISASIKGDGVSYFAKTVTISQPITVVAAAQNTYTVTCFTSDGSKIYATYTQKTQGEALSFMEPVNQGYTFAGWYVKNGTEPLIEPGETFAPTQDTSVYAHWNAITYNITYNLNGGTNYQGAPATYTIETPDIELGTPTRDGFTFLGWYNNADFTGDVITTISTGNYGAINLFARWKEQSESSCIDYGTWLFENNMTVGQKPAHAVSTTATTFSAFAVDQINFSSQKITYESGTGEFGGWKINTKGASITFCVDNNCAVSIRVGQLKSAMSITYIDADGKSQTTNLTANTTNAFIVSGETTVTLTTAGSSTVVLKEITVTDPCYIEPAYTVKRQHFGPTETVDQTEIGSINLAGAGVTYTLKETINGEGYGLTASFDAENGKMYIAGTTSNTSGKTQTLNITYVFQNDCSTKRTFEVTIPVDIYAGNPKLAYIIDGEKDGDFIDYNQSHAEGTALFEKLKQNFDVYAVNCYATVDETDIYNYYKDYDILLMTDYPNTSITKTINKKKYSYSNAVGCMVDKKPILTFETFVADLDNWHIDSNPKSPEGADATNQMTLLCNANDILKTADFNVGKKVTMATQLPSPSLQGFEPKDAPDFVFIATIPRYSSPDSTKLLITCCERQTNIKARMMVLGMQSNTYEVISDSGYMVVCGLLKYLLLDDNIPDCSLIFHGNNATSTSWQTAANWEGNTIPSDLSPVRIDAPCVVDITSAKAGTVKINQKLNDEEVQLHGSLTINSDAALTVTKFVRTMTVETPEPHATAVSDLHILSTATGNGALIFDNANGDTKATVNYYSISAGESNGNGGLQNAKWQWMTTPYNDVKDVQYNYYGAWMRRYDNATHKWIDMYNGCSMTPFGGYELTQYGATTYEMQGTLATTANQTIKLAPYLNVIGNSWTAPINISQFTTDDFTNAEATIVMLNTGLDEKGTGSVTTVDAKTADVRTAGTYVSIPINVASEIPQYKVIPSMQSFQIRAGGEGGSLTLNYDKIVRTASPVIQPMRAPGRATGEQNEENGINERLRIYVQGNNYGDYIYLFQHDGTTMDFDNGWDGRKFRSSNLAIPTLMARSGTDNWHISTQPQFAGTQIAFYQGEDNFYTIGFSYSGYETLWFYDNVTDQYTEINNENTYVFISNTTALQKRFEIRDYNPKAIEVTTGTDEVESSESGVQKVILHEKLYILNQGHVYNAQGKQVK